MSRTGDAARLSHAGIRPGLLLYMLIAMSGLPPAGRAVQPYVPGKADPLLEPWRVKHMEQLDGRGIACVDEAPDGSLWFGGSGELIHYDGLNIEAIPFDEELLAMMPVVDLVPMGRALEVADDGSLLLIIDNSFVSYRDGTWNVLLSGLESAWHPNDWLQQDADGTVWLQTARTLRRYEKSLKECLIVMELPEGSLISAFCLDQAGGVWVASMDQDQKGILTHIPFKDGVPASARSTFPMPCQKISSRASMVSDQNGNVWYGDNLAETGLLGFNAASGTWMPDRRGCRQGHYSLVIGRDGTLWAGGFGELLSMQGGRRAVYAMSRLGLPSVRLVLKETVAEGLVIIGEYMNVFAVDTGTHQWKSYPGLNFQCESAEGRRWFLSEDGGVVLNDPVGQQWLRYDRSDGVIDMPVAVTAAKSGQVWAAGSHDGVAAVSIFDGTAWRRRTYPDFATGIGYRSGFEAADGTLWFGASGDEIPGSGQIGGALQLRASDDGMPEIISWLTPPDTPYRIAGFAQTPDGTLWLGASVIRYLTADATQVARLTDLPFRWTDQMTVDRSGALWVAKGGFGIYRSRSRNVWDTYKQSDGLASDVVSCLWPLSDGTLLAGTDAGISRFDGETWIPQVFPESFMMGRESGTIRQTMNGEIWLNFSSRDWYFRNEQIGEGDPDAVMPFYTVRYTADTDPPETIITDYLEKVSQPGNTLVSWAARDLWANTPSGQLQFSWRLDGGTWSPYTLQRRWTFLDLPHGRHLLEVRARDRDFNVDPTPASVQFTVIAPIWLQPWFIAMVITIVGGAIAFIWMQIHYHDKRLHDQQRHLLEMDQLKTGFFTNISHELRTPLTVIRGPLERLLRTEKDEEKKQMLSVALRNANRVSTLVSQLLDFRRLEQGKMGMDITEGDIAECLLEVVDSLQPVATANQVECKTVFPDVLNGWFDSDMLRKIAHNLINNAIKYTSAGGEIRIVLKTFSSRNGTRMLSLTVEDTGIGIAPEHMEHIFERFYRIPEKSIVDGSGIGLHLTKELVDLWGGEIRAESPVHNDPDRPGTRFTVHLPIDRESLSSNGARE